MKEISDGLASHPLVIHFREFHEHIISHESNLQNKCDYCEFVATNDSTLKDHTYEKHADFVMVHVMARQVNDMSENFIGFQAKYESILNTILENQNAIKQELFVLRNRSNESTQSVKEHVKTIVTSSDSNSINSVSTTDINSKRTLDNSTPNPGKSPIMKPVSKSTQTTIQTTMQPKILHLSDAKDLFDKSAVERASKAKGTFLFLSPE